MTESEDGFLGRWARRKAETRAEVAERDKPEPAPDPEAEREAAALAKAREAEVVARLPDIDAMDESSDFSVFMQEGVPDVLRRKALRKLWRLNPVFANLDGLNDYDEDFTDAATVVANLKTLFQVGKGMPDPKLEEKPEGDEEAVPEAEEVATGEEPDSEDSGVAEAEGSAEPEAATPTALPESSETAVRADLADAAEPVTPRSGRSARARRWGGFDAGPSES